MGEGKVQGSGDHIADQRLLVLVPQRRDQPAAEQRGVEEGLDHPGAAQLLEDHRDVETGAAEAALRLGEERADHPQIGEGAPDLGAEAGLALQDRVARRGGVAVGQEAAQAVLQHLALVGQIEVHFPPPSLTLAMIPRWISFEPPKIDSLRLLKYSAATGPM